MPEMLFIHEYVKDKRTAHVLENLTKKNFSVYCYCCGMEAQSDEMATEHEARSWAEDWVLGQRELPAMALLAEQQGGCGCSH